MWPLLPCLENKKNKKKLADFKINYKENNNVHLPNSKTNNPSQQ